MTAKTAYRTGRAYVIPAGNDDCADRVQAASAGSARHLGVLPTQ